MKRWGIRIKEHERIRQQNLLASKTPSLATRSAFSDNCVKRCDFMNNLKSVVQTCNEKLEKVEKD